MTNEQQTEGDSNLSTIITEKTLSIAWEMTRFAMYTGTANGDARSVVRGNILKIKL